MFVLCVLATIITTIAMNIQKMHPKFALRLLIVCNLRLFDPLQIMQMCWLAPSKK